MQQLAEAQARRVAEQKSKRESSLRQRKVEATVRPSASTPNEASSPPPASTSPAPDTLRPRTAWDQPQQQPAPLSPSIASLNSLAPPSSGQHGSNGSVARVDAAGAAGVPSSTSVAQSAAAAVSTPDTSTQAQTHAGNGLAAGPVEGHARQMPGKSTVTTTTATAQTLSASQPSALSTLKKDPVLSAASPPQAGEHSSARAAESRTHDHKLATHETPPMAALLSQLPAVSAETKVCLCLVWPASVCPPSPLHLSPPPAARTKTITTRAGHVCC
jgi:hypothetical protein